MVLATVDFLTGFAHIFRNSSMCGLSGKVRGRLVVAAMGFMLWGFPGHAMALAVFAPMVQGDDSLVCKLHDVGPVGAGQPGAGTGVSLLPSACRMLRVAVQIAAGTPSEGPGGGETGSPHRRLGNTVDSAEYRVDVCEKTTGLILLDEYYPFVHRMLVQGGRDPGYGQDVDYVHFRHGFTVQPVAAGEYIRLILAPWFGRVSVNQPVQALEAPGVDSLQVSTTVDLMPGQWLELGGYRKETTVADESAPRRILGNSRDIVRVWVKVDDINVPD